MVPSGVHFADFSAEYEVILEGSDVYGNRMQPHRWTFGIIDAPEEVDQESERGESDYLPILIGSASAVFVLLISSAAVGIIILRRIRSK